MLWIEDSDFTVKNVLMYLFLTNTVFTSQDINWWTGVVWITCDVFISCSDSHSDGTHSLQRIHWWANDVMLHFYKSVAIKKQTHLHLGWLEGESLLIIFRWTVPLKTQSKVGQIFTSPYNILVILSTCMKYSSSKQSTHGSATSIGRTSLEISQHLISTILSCHRYRDTLNQLNTALFCRWIVAL